MFKEKLVIDIMKRNYSKIQCLIGDTLELDIDILVNGEPFNIESFNVSIEQGLENGNFNIQSDGITKKKNSLICSLSNKFTSIKGDHFIDISIIKSEYKKTTFKIPFEVHEGAIPENSSEQEITISILEELKAEVAKAQEITEPLISSINQAATVKNQLNSAITEGRTISDALPDTIKQAETQNTTLTQTINTAKSTNTTLGNTNNTAKQTNTTLTSTINTANTTKTQLQDVINQANVGNLVTKDEFTPVKNKTEALNSIKENGGAFAGYSFSEWSINPLGDRGKSLGSSAHPFKDAYVRGSAFEDWGYCKLTNGLILCWGTDKRDGNSNEEVEFDAWFKTAFPNQCLKIVLSLENNTYDMGKFTGLCLLDQLGANQRPQEGFKWRAIVRSDHAYKLKVNWFAIGF